MILDKNYYYDVTTPIPKQEAYMSICLYTGIPKIRLCLPSDKLIYLNFIFFPVDEEPIAYLSDEEHDRVIAFNPRQMSLMKVIETKGSAPYPIDGAGPDHVYVSTRGSKSIDVISNKNLAIIRTISLSHHPRSVAYNKGKQRVKEYFMSFLSLFSLILSRL